MTEMQQLVDKKVFTLEEKVNLLPGQPKKVIRPFMFLKENFTPGDEFLKLKSRSVAGYNQRDRDLYED